MQTAEKPNPEKEAIMLHSMLEGIRSLHFQPTVLDDDFSGRVFDLYFNKIDRFKIFLHDGEMMQLRAYKAQLDDLTLERNFEFFDKSFELVSNGIARADKWQKEYFESPLDLNDEEFFETDPDKRAYAPDEPALQMRWKKVIEYAVLDDLLKEEKKDDKKEEGEKRSFKELEKEARKKQRKIHKDWFDRLSKLERKDRLADYFNSISSSFDPHTNYFKPKDRDNFDMRMSGQLEGIGAQLIYEDGYTKVLSIVPGSASFRQGELEAGDLILAVGQGEKEPVNVAEMRLDDVVVMIRGKKGTEVRLTIRKKNNEEKIIPITRDVVVLEEGYAKAAIINKKDGEKTGYIYLPKFYFNMRDRNGRAASDDILKALNEFKEAGVTGTILDLRSNGGGSLNDVVKLAGLFIEEGPIVQVKGKDRPASILNDPDPKVQYKDPLVVMVNSYSASASEIMAGAIQDYGRGVVIGSNSTFGKGTVQRFIDLDQGIRGRDDLKPLGSVKLTTQKFYRINGDATQLKGVVPDIILPDVLDEMEIGEREQDYPMEWTTIDPCTYGQNVFKLNKNQLIGLIAKSNERIRSNEVFQTIQNEAKFYKDQRNQSSYPLNWDAYKKRTNETNTKRKSFDKETDDDVLMEITPLKLQAQEILTDSIELARFDDFKDGIETDVYIEEALNIMDDIN